MKKIILAFVVITLMVAPGRASAQDKGKEILATAAYGVVAGSIIGVATLAFVSSPGGKLRNIALGASLGLYAGVLLGAYLAYGVSLEPEVIDEDDEFYDDEEEEEDASIISNRMYASTFLESYIDAEGVHVGVSGFDKDISLMSNTSFGTTPLFAVPVVTYNF